MKYLGYFEELKKTCVNAGNAISAEYDVVDVKKENGAAPETITVATRKRDEAVSQIIDEANAKIKSIRENLKAEVENFYKLDTERIDHNMVATLNVGLKYTSEEIADILSKYTDNVTMYRIVADWCAKNGVYCQALPEKEGVLSIYDDAARRMGKMLSRDELVREAGLHSVENYYPIYEKSVNEIPVQPGVLTVSEAHPRFC